MQWRWRYVLPIARSVSSLHTIGINTADDGARSLRVSAESKNTARSREPSGRLS